MCSHLIEKKNDFLTRDLLKIFAHWTVLLLSVTLIESLLFALLQIHWKVLKCEWLYLLSATNVVFRALMVLVHFQAEPFVPFLCSVVVLCSFDDFRERFFVLCFEFDLVRNLTPILRYSRWENIAIKEVKICLRFMVGNFFPYFKPYSRNLKKEKKYLKPGWWHW